MTVGRPAHCGASDNLFEFLLVLDLYFLLQAILPGVVLFLGAKCGAYELVQGLIRLYIVNIARCRSRLSQGTVLCRSFI